MKLYRIFQALSLDVVLGINLFTFAIEKYYGTFSSWHTYLGLSMAIWLIYTGDHLLDARKIKGNPSTFRHRFHKKYRKPLIIISVLMFITGLANLFYLPLTIIYGGVLLVLITGIYFLLLQKAFFWAKEICVAAIYTFGVFIGPLAFTYRYLNSWQWLLLPQVFVLALINLLLFSWMDVIIDERDGHTSMIIRWGISRSGRIIKLFLLAGLFGSCAIIFFNAEAKTVVMQLVIILMYLVLAFVFRYNRIFRRNDAYRIIGDGIFYLPVIYIVYAC